MKRISSLDVLGEVRRAKRILNRVQAYLEQQERHQLRVTTKRGQRAWSRAIELAGQP